MRRRTTCWRRRSIQRRKNVGPPGRTSVSWIVVRSLCPRRRRPRRPAPRTRRDLRARGGAIAPSRVRALRSHRVVPMMRADAPPCTENASRSGAWTKKCGRHGLPRRATRARSARAGCEGPGSCGAAGSRSPAAGPAAAGSCRCAVTGGWPGRRTCTGPGAGRGGTAALKHTSGTPVHGSRDVAVDEHERVRHAAPVGESSVTRTAVGDVPLDADREVGGLLGGDRARRRRRGHGRRCAAGGADAPRPPTSGRPRSIEDAVRARPARAGGRPRTSRRARGRVSASGRR